MIRGMSIRMRVPVPVFLVLLALLVALLAAGCGGSDGSGSDGSSDDTSSESTDESSDDAGSDDSGSDGDEGADDASVAARDGKYDAPPTLKLDPKKTYSVHVTTNKGEFDR